ncbi:MAG: DUF2442 domain-containing protein [Acidobacteria bacterium]|nr:DUF2442 domain-containing protein [Acidobacteriota bacterium]
MKHPIFRVRDVEIVAPYTLSVSFDDDTRQIINFEPVLRGELYGPLRDLDLLRRVQVDRDAHTLVWPNGADFDPASLHNWPECEGAFVAMAAQWEAVRA